MKEHNINFRADTETRKMLAELAESRKTPASEILRKFIHRTYAAEMRKREVNA